MIAVDTNLLVYAHDRSSPFHRDAQQALAAVVDGSRWAIPWPCIHEFVSIVTHPRALRRPQPAPAALAAVRGLFALPGMCALGEAEDHLDQLGRLFDGAEIRGPKVHDARIAAICLSHGVGELLTADRDFSYFPRLRTRNPLVAR